MICKDCSNFKCNSSMEASKEISPNMRSEGGKCSINGKNCKAQDKCGCGGFTRN